MFSYDLIVNYRKKSTAEDKYWNKRIAHPASEDPGRRPIKRISEAGRPGGSRSLGCLSSPAKPIRLTNIELELVFGADKNFDELRNE